MRIVLLHYAAPPTVGGVESVIGRHARLFADDGHNVAIMAGRGARTDPRIAYIDLPAAGSRLPEVLAVKSELDLGQVTKRFEGLVAELVDELTRRLEGIDVLIAHNVCSLNKNLALTAALRILFDRQPGFRLILWHHDLAWTAARYRNELYEGYPWELLKTDWPGAIQVTISPPRRQELATLLKIPLERVHVVPNGIDVREFLKLEDQTLAFVDKLDLLHASPLFLLPVRITSRKNIELAIQVMAVCQKKYPDLKLVVTGPLGPHNPANIQYFNQLVDLRCQLGLDRQVIFMAEQSPDYLPDKVIADFYRLSDALIFPSREEGFGIPVLEAGITNIPVFCSDIPVLSDLGKDMVTYFSADSSPEHISAAIIKRLESDLTFKLRSHVKRKYTWDQIYSEQIKPLVLS